MEDPIEIPDNGMDWFPNFFHCPSTYLLSRFSIQGNESSFNLYRSNRVMSDAWLELSIISHFRFSNEPQIAWVEFL